MALALVDNRSIVYLVELACEHVPGLNCYIDTNIDDVWDLLDINLSSSDRYS
jgi:hypothetical protein